jgi:CBS domain-containing protein
MKAKDIMKKRVVAIRPEMLVQEVAQVFDDKGISGAPVIDNQGHLLGVVSKSDLVHHQRDGEGDHFSFYKAGSGVEVLPKGYHMELPDRTRVREIMTPVIIQAKESTPVRDIARMMRRKHIHRVFIMEGKKMKGVVTTMDLLKLFDGGKKKN